MTPQHLEPGRPLPDLGRALLLLLFGGLTTWLVRALDAPGMSRTDLLLLAAGGGALVTALVWFFILGARRSAAWGIALLIPYVNLVAASYFARRYWGEGARAPALLALAGLVAQTVAATRLLWPALPSLV